MDTTGWVGDAVEHLCLGGVVAGGLALLPLSDCSSVTEAVEVAFREQGLEFTAIYVLESNGEGGDRVQGV